MYLPDNPLKPLDTPFVAWRELRSYRKAPVLALPHFRSPAPHDGLVVRTPGRFLQAYWQFYGTAFRVFQLMSFIFRHGTDASPAEPVFARARRHALRSYGLDIPAFFIQARILCDQALPLISRSHPDALHHANFLSLNKHRTQLIEGAPLPAGLAPWKTYVEQHTAWFPALTLIRDDFIVHYRAPHSFVMAIHSGRDLGLRFTPYRGCDPTLLGPPDTYQYVSPRAILREITRYLTEVARAAQVSEPPVAFYDGPAVK